MRIDADHWQANVRHDALSPDVELLPDVERHASVALINAAMDAGERYRAEFDAYVNADDATDSDVRPDSVYTEPLQPNEF